MREKKEKKEKAPKVRDPRVDPRPGDVLRDFIGTLKIVRVDTRVHYDFLGDKATGAIDRIPMRCSLSKAKWRQHCAVVEVEVVSQV